jgi:hypothetical protein
VVRLVRELRRFLKVKEIFVLEYDGTKVVSRGFGVNISLIVAVWLTQR